MLEMSISRIDRNISEISRLENLVSDLEELMNLESPERKINSAPIDLRDLLDALHESFAFELEKKDISLECIMRVDTVSADEALVQRALYNLLSNAVKHSPEGGMIDVATVSNEGYWRVCVTDSGPGIPDSFRGEVFKKFAQADATDRRRQGGTGLGLSISKAIIDRLGGRIGFDSEPGIRTSFYFELPKMQPYWTLETGGERIVASTGLQASAE